MSDIYPNPFNSNTKIRFYIPNVSEHNDFIAEIRIYDLLGRLITRKIDNVKSGYHEFSFDAEKHNLSSGLYFCELIVQVFIN